MEKNYNSKVEQLWEQANTLFPELKVRLEDVHHPTETFLTRVFIHCLRRFGFRVDPPYNIDSEPNITSKEKRIFLAKLCRQVERIWQISFPAKTFTYYDIIQPTAKKSSNALDALFNYWLFYKWYKKEVMPPILEKQKKREAALAAIKAKRQELENIQKRTVQNKADIAECEINIRKLREALPKPEAELAEKAECLRQLKAEMATQEEQLAAITRELNHMKQLVVLDKDVESLKKESEEMVKQIENYKADITKHEHIFKERRAEIDNIVQLNNEIDEISNFVPPDVLSAYRESVKLSGQLEKGHASLLAKQNSLQNAKQNENQLLQQCEAKIKSLKLQMKENVAVEDQKSKELTEIINKQHEKIEQLKNSLKATQEKIVEEQQRFEYIKNTVKEIFPKHD